MFCGSPSGSYVDDHGDFYYPRLRSSSSSSSSSKSKRRDKNPYSDRGLDKFATVVADLEAKKEKIIREVASRGADPDDAVLVRFKHSPSHGGWVPIVVGKKKQKKQTEDPKTVVEKSQDSKQVLPAAVSSSDVMNATKVDGQRSSSSSMRTWFDYWPVVLILILVCLVTFGRSFAILCTSIWWYLVPMISSGDRRRPGLWRKEHGIRRADEILIKNMGGDMKAYRQLKVGSPPRHHLHHHMQARK